MGRSGSKEKSKNKAGRESSNSVFSKTTFGDTQYIAYGSISIEQLQFIPLSAEFGRQAMSLNNDLEGREVAKELTKFLRKLSKNDSPEAKYHKNYVRRGSIYDEGEAGVLLNDAAIDVLVNETLNLLDNLSIRQAKGYMFVDHLEIDYNDGVGKNMMRIKHSEQNVESNKKQDYAIYYYEGLVK